ncbi:protein CANDIDATE G-PROTEIN COUPLED RECEPTOR 7-like [Impatiens glandulifera]|uniref:protein CANDIDATE G-PROTEIN COUPLED RECEPTOR 7-like n=1 Tax=Impatiens glandulifera TaxID=253017 RepID=UPI001FB0AD76|nr:protein CANDIDATE G-PROTEIN COUPLED RECEPTOR 7-like [Impatiens glandulifera]
MPATSSTAAYAITILHCLLLLLLSPSATAEIKNLKFTADARPVISLENFGFTHSGQINIAVSIIASSSRDPSQLGLFLVTKDSLNLLILEIEQKPFMCMLESNHIILLNLSYPLHSNFNISYPITSPNEYYLFFANCYIETQLTMEVRTDIYSIDIDSSGAPVKNYLSAELTQLPTVQSLFSLTYFMFLVFWICFIFLTNKRSSIHRIHHLMSLLLLIKTLTLISAAADNHNVKITGTPNGWHVVFYVFQFIENVLLYTVIVLLAAGNCFRQLMIVILLQVLANVAFVVIGESGPSYENWVIWNQCFLIVDMMCCCAIIFPLVRSIRSLRREASKTDLGKAANKKLLKLTIFIMFYVGYICFTRIGVLV